MQNEDSVYFLGLVADSSPRAAGSDSSEGSFHSTLNEKNEHAAPGGEGEQRPGSAVSATGGIFNVLSFINFNASTDMTSTLGRNSSSLDKKLSPRVIQLKIKRGIDVVFALLGLWFLSPLFIAVACLIKLESRGPVFFRQDRTGLDNSTFEILKFRTMYLDLCDFSGVEQTAPNDARVTRIGRVLRRTNIDELPQLINILRGDMSLIGPRPHVPNMLAADLPYEELVENYPLRHMVRPGLTGLAQSHGLRGPTIDRGPSVKRIEYDLEYIERFSLWLDLEIMVRTVIRELKNCGQGF